MKPVSGDALSARSQKVDSSSKKMRPATAQFAAAADIAADFDLPPEAIAGIAATLVRHGLTATPGKAQPLADEVTTSQAARVLNVDRKTVRKYIDGGLLPFRDKASPGSTQPRRLIRLADVQRLKAYGFASPPSTSARRSKRSRPAVEPFKHITLDATF